MVAGAVERNTGIHETAQRSCQRSPCRIKNSEVKQPCRTWRRGRAAQALPGIERYVMMVPARGYESCAVAISLSQFESKNAAVKVQRAAKVRNFQMDMANPHASVDRLIMWARMVRCCLHDYLSLRMSGHGIDMPIPPTPRKAHSSRRRVGRHGLITGSNLRKAGERPVRIQGRGVRPLCYREDVTPEMVERHRKLLVL